jgi:hypothetical protein
MLQRCERNQVEDTILHIPARDVSLADRWDNRYASNTQNDVERRMDTRIGNYSPPIDTLNGVSYLNTAASQE